MSRFDVDVVLFDLDGTLLDTIDDLTVAANLMLQTLGEPQRSRAEIHSFVGRGLRDLTWRCLTDGRDAPAPDDAAIDAAMDVFRRHYVAVNGEQTRIYPDVEPCLARLADEGYRLAVVTNKLEAFTTPLLARMGLAHYFPVVVAGDTLATRKPHPDVLFHACRALGSEPARALMIGDSANDADAARAAGMPMVLVDYGYSEGLPIAQIDRDVLISSPLQLFDYLMPRPVAAS